MAITAITTSNSISVKPHRSESRERGTMTHPHTYRAMLGGRELSAGNLL
jgi:hypothetical protein